MQPTPPPPSPPPSTRLACSPLISRLLLSFAAAAAAAAAGHRRSLLICFLADCALFLRSLFVVRQNLLAIHEFFAIFCVATRAQFAQNVCKNSALNCNFFASAGDDTRSHSPVSPIINGRCKQAAIDDLRRPSACLRVASVGWPTAAVLVVVQAVRPFRALCDDRRCHSHRRLKIVCGKRSCWRHFYAPRTRAHTPGAATNGQSKRTHRCRCCRRRRRRRRAQKTRALSCRVHFGSHALPPLVSAARQRLQRRRRRRRKSAARSLARSGHSRASLTDVPLPATTAGAAAAAVGCCEGAKKPRALRPRRSRRLVGASACDSRVRR